MASSSSRVVRGHKISCGQLLPFGVSHVPNGVNFSIFSTNATACTLVLFDQNRDAPLVEIPFPPEFKLGHVWAMTVHDLAYENLQYGFRMDGPWNPPRGIILTLQKSFSIHVRGRLLDARTGWPRVSRPTNRFFVQRCPMDRH